MNKLATIVIPNWNGKDLLSNCLKSLERQTYEPFEVLVIDNGSTDGSIECIESNYPYVKIICFEQNQGFSVAVNAGIKKAKGDYIVLLNNDTEAEPDWLENLVSAMEKHPDIGFGASKMLNYYQRDKVDSAGDRVGVYPYPRGIDCQDGPQYSVEQEIFSACAGAAIYRKEIFEKVGMFDEEFFAYYEDVDLCYRAQWLGIKGMYFPQAIIYHVHMATSKRIPRLSFILNSRNVFFVHLKNTPRKLLGNVVLTLTILRFLSLIRFAIKSKDIKILFELPKEIVRNIPMMLSKRRQIMNSAVLNQEEMIQLLDPIEPFYKFVLKKIRKKLFSTKESQVH